MSKSTILKELVKRQELHSLELPDLKRKDSSFDFLDKILKFIKGLFPRNENVTSEWVLYGLKWLLLVILIACVVGIVLKYLKKSGKRKSRQRIKEFQTVYSAKDEEILSKIKLAIRDKNYKRAMKLRWLYKLQQRDRFLGLTLSDIFKSSQAKTQQMNYMMFSPQAEVTKQDYEELKKLKFSKNRGGNFAK